MCIIINCYFSRHKCRIGAVEKETWIKFKLIDFLLSQKRFRLGK